MSYGNTLEYRTPKIPAGPVTSLGEPIPAGSISVRVIGFNQGHQNILHDEHVKRFGQEILEYIEKKGDSDYCFNFNGMEFFSGYGLGKLVTFNGKHRKVRGNRTIGIVGENSVVLRPFYITYLDRVFDIKRTLEEFLEARARLV